MVSALFDRAESERLKFEGVNQSFRNKKEKAKVAVKNIFNVDGSDAVNSAYEKEKNEKKQESEDLDLLMKTMRSNAKPHVKNFDKKVIDPLTRMPYFQLWTDVSDALFGRFHNEQNISIGSVCTAVVASFSILLRFSITSKIIIPSQRNIEPRIVIKIIHLRINFIILNNLFSDI